MYEEYALLDNQIKELTNKKELLREKIVTDMNDRGTDKESHSLGKFTITRIKKWFYTPETIDFEEKLKAQKAKEQSTGDATFEETESLRFTSLNV